MCQGSAQAEPSGKAGASSAKRTARRKDPTVIATKEVIGRQIAVWSDTTMEWSKASIAQFNADTSQHLIRFLEREAGSVKHEERWVNLAKTRFQWLSPPAPTAAPNPTNQGAPKGEDAVGYQVRVFWPGMAKWYQGKIEAYDSETKEHTVKYRDGDVKKYKLRHEAVVYLDKSSTPAKKDKPKNGGSSSKDNDKKVAKSKSGKAVAGSKRKGGAVESSGDDDAPRKGKGSASKKNSSRDPTPPKKRKNNNAKSAASTSVSSEIDDEDDEEGEEEDDDMDSEEESEEESSDDEDDEEEITDTEDDDDDAERARGRGRPPGSKAGKISKGSRKTPGAAGVKKSKGSGLDGAPRRRGRPPGSGTGRRIVRTGRSSRKDIPGPPRMPRAEEEIIKNAGAAVVNARVAVFWNEDEAYYKGKLIQFDSYHKRHKVVYDDGEEEWVALTRESFRYLTPRARSAGCDSEFRSAMAQLGALQELGGAVRRNNEAAGIQGTAAPLGEVAPAPPAAEESAGWELSVRGAGDGRWHRAEVLCYDAQRSQHYLLYADGEDEWANLAEEEVVWHRKVPTGRDGLFPGKAPGVEAPSGRGGVGWRVAVFWPGDAAFYPGEIAGWDESAGQYEVSYDDGEEGTIKLSEDRIKWILPPGVAVDHENLERMEVGGGRPRRRVTAAGADSDPDYEFEHATVYPGSARGRRGGLGGGFGGRGGGGRGRHGSTAAAMGWGDSLGGEGSDAMPSPLAAMQRGGAGMTPFAAGPGWGGLPAGLAAATAAGPIGVPEGFTGDPVVHRSITRVPAFGCPSTGSEVRLPAAITVKIYLSGKEKEKEGSAGKSPASSGGTAAPTTPATVDAETATPAPAAAAAAVAPATSSAMATDSPATDCAATDATTPAAAAAPPSSSSPPTAVTEPTQQPSQPSSQQRRDPASKLQARLDALDLMARRVGRAQQTIVKGVPTDLPATAVRPLRLGPPPSVARLVAAPGVVAPARRAGGGAGGGPNGMHSSHRLARPSMHSPFHRRRSLDEEDDTSEEEDDENARSDDSGDDDDETTREDGGSLDRRNNEQGLQLPQSSSGSSDDEREGDSGGEEEVVVSPRSPSFPRGGKVKPTAAGQMFGNANGGGGSGDLGGSTREQSPAMANGASSPMVTGIRPAVPPSPFIIPPVQDSVAAAAGGGNDLKDLPGMPSAGLPTADSVANLLTLPRNHSAGMLLGEMPAGHGGADSTQHGTRFMDLA